VRNNKYKTSDIYVHA